MVDRKIGSKVRKFESSQVREPLGIEDAERDPDDDAEAGWMAMTSMRPPGESSLIALPRRIP